MAMVAPERDTAESVGLQQFDEDMRLYTVPESDPYREAGLG